MVSDPITIQDWSGLVSLVIIVSESYSWWKLVETFFFIQTVYFYTLEKLVGWSALLPFLKIIIHVLNMGYSYVEAPGNFGFEWNRKTGV